MAYRSFLRSALLLTACALMLPAARAQEGFAEGKPPIVDIIGENRTVKIEGIHDPNGKVLWFNEALAREMGINLPRGGWTPEFERTLVDQLSWRLPRPGEDITGRKTVPMYADRYGGWGMGYNKGAGRAAFFGKYNLNIKGVGATPLVSSATHESHRHGGAPMKEGFLEAVWGEVGINLFSRGSTRILGVVDVGDHTTWADGGKERRALILRAGDQLRPAHLLAEGFSKAENLAALERMLEHTGDLVRKTLPSGESVIDARASLERLAEKHARTASEMYRYRILHGGLSPGNKSIDGGMLDLGTITSQPRTAPVHVLDYTEPGSREVRSDLKFETENAWRERDLKTFQELFESARGKPGYEVARFDVAESYRQAYQRQVELQLLQATGLKPSAAEALRASDAELVKKYAETLRELGRMTNKVEMNIERSGVERGSVVDIFKALSEMPAITFSNQGEAGKRVLEALAPQADRPEDLERARRGANELAELHKKVLERAWTSGQGEYDSRSAFESSVRERAAFENRPLDGLFRKALNERLVNLISEYERTGDAKVLRETVTNLIDESKRSVAGLQNQGRSRMDGERIVTGERNVNGLNYSFLSGSNGERSLRVELPLEARGDSYRVAGTGETINSESARNLNYRYTLDGWKSHGEARGTIGLGADGKPAAIFEVPVESGRILTIEGAFRAGEAWINNGGANFKGYRGVAPDRADARRVEVELRAAMAGLDSKYSTYEVGRDATAREVERFAEKARKLGAIVELVPASDPRLPGQGRTYIDAEGRTRVLLPSDRPVKFFALVDELVHVHQFKKIADTKGPAAARELLERAARGDVEARKTVLEFEAEAKRMLRLITPKDAPGRAALETESRAIDESLRALEKYRRSDGTLNWKEITRNQALKQGAGVAHFALALFLKELAVVVKTGDRLRIEEFFDGLATTDFFVTYGLFSVGAQAGSVAYTKFLERHIKPGFVSGVLKQNVILATGMALPEIVRGHFDGKTFAIHLGSLGLSTLAVQGGLNGLKWVVNLKKAEQAGQLAATASKFRRLAKFGGWFYTAAETAVVLYLSDEITKAYTNYLDENAARKALEDANTALLAAAAGRGDLAKALEDFNAAQDGWRNFLYKPLAEAEALYQSRLARVATNAKRLADERAAIEERFNKMPALAAVAERRYGSREAAVEAMMAEKEAELTKTLEEAANALQSSRDEHLRKAFEDNRRSGAMLSAEDRQTLNWIARGATPGAAGDPQNGRTDIFARFSRDRALNSARSALGKSSENRPQSYQDQDEVLTLARGLAASRGDSASLAALDQARADLSALSRADQDLIRGNFRDLSSRGAAGELEELGR